MVVVVVTMAVVVAVAVAHLVRRDHGDVDC